jgi:hypothetical protein
MEYYTHTLAITIIDVDGHTLSNDELILELKQKLCNTPLIHDIYYNKDIFSCIFYWVHLDIGLPFSQLMGDLFVKSFYDDDIILYRHLKLSLALIDKEMNDKYENMKWSIVFHLSKIIRE